MMMTLTYIRPQSRYTTYAAHLAEVLQDGSVRTYEEIEFEHSDYAVIQQWATHHLTSPFVIIQKVIVAHTLDTEPTGLEPSKKGRDYKPDEIVEDVACTAYER